MKFEKSLRGFFIHLVRSLQLEFLFDMKHKTTSVLNAANVTLVNDCFDNSQFVSSDINAGKNTKIHL